MSGYQRPRDHSALGLRLPRLQGQTQGTEIINGAFTMMERADLQNVKKNIEPSFPSLLLLAPNGSSYRITVDNTGALVAVQVPVPPS
jgi:hypothetical protein